MERVTLRALRQMLTQLPVPSWHFAQANIPPAHIGGPLFMAFTSGQQLDAPGRTHLLTVRPITATDPLSDETSMN